MTECIDQRIVLLPQSSLHACHALTLTSDLFHWWIFPELFLVIPGKTGSRKWTVGAMHRSLACLACSVLAFLKVYIATAYFVHLTHNCDLLCEFVIHIVLCLVHRCKLQYRQLSPYPNNFNIMLAQLLSPRYFSKLLFGFMGPVAIAFDSIRVVLDLMIWSQTWPELGTQIRP